MIKKFLLYTLIAFLPLPTLFSKTMAQDESDKMIRYHNQINTFVDEHCNQFKNTQFKKIYQECVEQIRNGLRKLCDDVVQKITHEVYEVASTCVSQFAPRLYYKFSVKQSCRNAILTKVLGQVTESHPCLGGKCKLKHFCWKSHKRVKDPLNGLEPFDIFSPDA